MGDGLVVLAPFVGLGDGFGFGGTEGISILIGRNNRLQQMHYGGKLARA